MKRIVRNPFAIVFLVMLAVALAAILTASKAEAGPGRCFCPLPEGCIFLGCDAQHNCMYQC
jgi:hypothetical protein